MSSEKSRQLMEVRLLTEADDEHWDTGLAQSRQGIWLQWSQWLRVVGRWLGPLEMVGVIRNGELIAGVAGLVDDRGGRRILRNNYVTAYHGLWVRDHDLSPSHTETLIRRVAEALVPFLNERCTDWAIACAPELVDTRPFGQLGCTVDVHYTYRLDLVERDALLANADKEARREIRKAESAGITLDVCDPTDENVEALENHMAVVAEREGWAGGRSTRGFFSEATRRAVDAGSGQLFLTRMPDGTPAASILCTWDHHRAYALLGGGDPNLMHTGANRFLHWSALNWLRDQGHGEVDLLGANVESLHLFKKKWNARLVPYFTVSGGSDTRSRLDHLRSAAKHMIRGVTGQG